MKIFLVGEGPGDCGWENNGSWEDGPVQIYLRRLIDNVDILTVHKSQIKAMRKNKRQKRSFQRLLGGHSLNAFFISQAAVDNGCDCAAMYLDGDEPSKEHRICQNRYNLLKAEILAGLQAGSNNEDVQTLVIIPMKMIESWMLGDQAAFLHLYKKELDHKYFRTPELIWGDKSDHMSDYPKNKLRRALLECDAKSTRNEFQKIAAEQDINELCRTCPISFGDFFAQVCSILQTELDLSPAKKT